MIDITCNFCQWRHMITDISEAVGEYVKHLIKTHWEVLEYLHEKPDEW